MSKDGLALLLLAAALGIGLAGMRHLIVGAARRDELRDRSMLQAPPSAMGALVQRAERGFEKTPYGHRLAMRLAGAGVSRTALEFVLVAGACGVGAYALLSLKFATFVCVVGAIAALRGVFTWLERKRAQRREHFVGQLPELARVLSNSASAGLGMTAALGIAVREIGDPASSELSIALEEVRIGSSFDEALAHLGERMPSRELGVLVNTLVIQQRSGGDLVRALSQMSETLEARKDTLREVKTLMAGAVSTAYIVAGLGIGSIFFIDIIRPGSLDKLTGSALGLLVLGVSLSAYAVGFLLVRQVTRIET